MHTRRSSRPSSRRFRLATAAAAASRQPHTRSAQRWPTETAIEPRHRAQFVCELFARLTLVARVARAMHRPIGWVEVASDDAVVRGEGGRRHRSACRCRRSKVCMCLLELRRERACATACRPHRSTHACHDLSGIPSRSGRVVHRRALAATYMSRGREHGGGHELRGGAGVGGVGVAIAQQPLHSGLLQPCEPDPACTWPAWLRAVGTAESPRRTRVCRGRHRLHCMCSVWLAWRGSRALSGSAGACGLACRARCTTRASHMATAVGAQHTAATAITHAVTPRTRPQAPPVARATHARVSGWRAWRTGGASERHEPRCLAGRTHPLLPRVSCLVPRVLSPTRADVRLRACGRRHLHPRSILGHTLYGLAFLTIELCARQNMFRYFGIRGGITDIPPPPDDRSVDVRAA